jgi:serine/threonine protein kinase
MSELFSEPEPDELDRQNCFRAAYRFGSVIAVNGRPFRVQSEHPADGSGERFVVRLTPVAAQFDPREYALKVSPAGADDRGASEAEVLARLDHPNVLRFVDAERTSTATHILTEWCDGGNLMDYWEVVGEAVTSPSEGRERGWTAATVRSILEMFVGVLDGVTHVHGRGEYHRDLKPKNILVKTVRGELLASISAGAKGTAPKRSPPPAKGTWIRGRGTM